MAGIEEDEYEKYDYQTPVLCGDCEGHKHVNSYCLNCAVNLCDKCKARSLHKKHRVLPRTHSEVIRSRKTKKSPCIRHPEKEYFTYCTKCKVPCCPICIIKDHSGHPFSDFEDAAKEARVAIESKIGNLETSLKSSEIQRQNIEDGISSYKKSVELVVEQSKARFKNLRDEIDRAEHDWMKELKQTKDKDLAKMGGMKSDLDEQINGTRESIASYENILEQSSDLELLLYLNEYKDPVSLKLSDITLPTLLHFQPSRYKFPTISELVGRIMQGEKRMLQTPTQVKGLDTYKAVEMFQSHMISVKQMRTVEIGKGRADTLLHNTQNDVFVNSQSKKTLYIYYENMKEKNSFSLDFEIEDMALTAEEDIIATDSSNKRVVRIDSSGRVSKVCSTAPLYPWGVCVNDRQQIVVGVRAELHEPPIKLVMYSPDGSTVLQEIEKDGSGNNLFSVGIYQVKQKGNGDYVVSDDARIVCVKREGEYRWEYRLRWTSFGIVCDQYDNIIVAERNGHTVSLLSKDGELVKTLLTKTDAIEYPNSLSIDKNGYLWIGQSKNVKVIQYLK